MSPGIERGHPGGGGLSEDRHPGDGAICVQSSRIAEHARLMGRDLAGAQAWEIIAAALEAGPIPRYGSGEHLALPVDDLRRRASELVAAEAWRTSSPAHPWGRALLVEELLVEVGRHLVAAEAVARVPLAAAVRAGRELAAHFRRVDNARAAGSDYGLPLEERRRIANQPRPGDRVGPITNADRSRAFRSFTERATQEVA